jgi:hypothetical protein
MTQRGLAMPALKYKVNLTEDEKLQLEAMISKGKSWGLGLNGT